MTELAERGKGFWTGVAVVVGLVALTPFVKWIDVNLFTLVGLFVAVTEITGFFVFEGLRHASEQALLMREGEHLSRSQVGEVVPLEGTPGISPSRTGITYGGLEIKRFNTANRHLIDVPKSAVERMDGDYLVYAPTAKLTAEQLYGVDPMVSDTAEASATNAYRAGERSQSQARYSEFNSLFKEPTASQVRTMNRNLKQHAKKVAEGMRRGELSEQANVRELRRLAEQTRRPSFWESAKRAVTGGPPTATPSEKPTGEESE